MKVTRLPIDPGPAGWNRLLEAPSSARVLEEDITADWLVIGAGFAGLAAARRLSQLCKGDRIAVVEAARVADGPAGRNSGFMIDLPHDLASTTYAGGLDADRAQTAMNRHGIGFAREAAEEYGLDAEAFTLSGKINAAATEKGHRHNLSYAAHLEALGEAYELRDAAQMRAMTGTGYYQSGLFTPGCAVIQPAKFVRGVAAGLVAQGVALYENSPVIELSRDGDWVARTAGGQITAPKVILAVNGHLARFGHFTRHLMHVFTYASMTRALSADEVARLGGQPVWGVTSADPMGTTVRRISGQGGDRITVRNRFTFDPSMEVDEARIAAVARDHDRSFAARFPMLADVGMEFRWGGRLCLSRNNVQIVREVEPDLFAACCQNGLGTAKGTLAGKLAAELACGERSAMLDQMLASDAPRKLPPAPLAAMGARAYLRWQERRAGREL
ncbi:FAD-binding oxidoreductase [uncultured Litoreibacter sp.]|uniref:NAD(P)/FAD-dependent oxidoreductase n=1 Tax=uncultured Litoreibacter sp. TaxID=1392394 RepID=UPI0026156348|nr:FAD-binding oxidoreductase [uncultured Litoreibacter sp.]